MSSIVNDIGDAPSNATAPREATTGATATTQRRKARSSTASAQPPTSKVDRPASQTRRRVRLAAGIYKDRWGLSATVKVNGIQREMRFDPGTPLKTIRARRDEMRASLRTLPPGERHTLAHDAERYLDQVRNTLVSFADRRRDLLTWLPRFGHLRTLALPSHLAGLNAQLHDWRRTLSAMSCNHRRHALTNLVRVLYGRRAAVELIDLARFAPAPPKPRWIDRHHIAEVLSHLTPGSLTRVRLELMHWTGMRPSQMGRLHANDFRLNEPIPYPGKFMRRPA